MYSPGPFRLPNFGNECYVDILQSRLAGCKLDFQSRVAEGDLQLNRYDLTILAGGGVLYHSVSGAGDSSLKYYLRYPAVAQWLGQKSMMMGVGAQGSIQSQDLVPYGSVLEGLDLCTVRDSCSARILRESGIRSSVLECADLFYTKTVYPKTGRGGLKTESREASRSSVWLHRSREWDCCILNLPVLKIASRRRCAFSRRTFRLHFFSFDNRSDPWLSDAAASWSSGYAYTRFDVSRPDSIDAFIHAFEAVDAFVTTRYHGVLLSIMTETPFLAIGAPGTKTASRVRSHPISQFISYASSPKQFAESAHEIWAEREALRPILTRGCPASATLAHA